MFRNYRFVRLAGLTYFKPMLSLYQRNPQLSELSYEQQLENLFFESYVYTDGFSRGMRALGHDAYEILHDCEPIQKRWASERGLKLPAENWKEWVILEQLRELQPDVVYFQDIHGISLETQRQLKSLCPSIKLLVLHKGFPGDPAQVTHYDLRLFGCPSILRHYQSHGIDGHLMYHSFDDAILQRIEKRYGPITQPEFDFTFLGSSGWGYDAHKARYWQLVRLALNTPLQMWIDEPWKGDEILLNAYRCMFSHLIETAPADIMEHLGTILSLTTSEGQQLHLPSFLTELVQVKHALLSRAQHQDGEHLGNPAMTMRALLPARSHEPLFGLEMYQTLQNSKITFNRHSDAANGDVGNMRMFQATGVGTCLISDTGANMGDLFEPDSEIVTYGSTEEAIEKFHYLREHENHRLEIARAGQRRTLHCHSAAIRAQFVDECVQKLLS